MTSHEELEKKLSKNPEYVKAKIVLTPYFDLIVYVMDSNLPKEVKDRIVRYIERQYYKIIK